MNVTPEVDIGHTSKPYREQSVVVYNWGETTFDFPFNPLLVLQHSLSMPHFLFQCHQQNNNTCHMGEELGTMPGTH